MPLNLFGKKSEPEANTNLQAADIELPEDQREIFEKDLNIIDENPEHADNAKLQRDAERQVISAAEESVKKLHVIKLGRCPNCGEPLYQHSGATICETCGWHKFDMPKTGGVRIHLCDGEKVVEGDRAYVLKDGTCLVIKEDVVFAQIPAHAYDWVEYNWRSDELEQRRQQAAGKLKIPCAWCNEETSPSKDGFHLVHVAFGSSQERYCFCSDDCLEAFQKMYPSRVHRNCYETDCKECNLCTKRYSGDAEEIRMLAKDYIRIK